MGIKKLNRFLREYCVKSITSMSLSELRDKKIVVDTSIYLYRFLGEGALIENMYLMISLFRNYNIKPIFIFDGKPPEEKSQTLEDRRAVKEKAKNKYNELSDLLKKVNDKDKADILMTMDNLKKKFIKISSDDINQVKELMRAYGVSYLDAPGEADELCAKYVLKNKVYACLSEDMDMFVYGCHRVMRYLSLTKSSVIMYDYQGILDELNLTSNEFREICVISGTDYNIKSNKNTSLHTTLKYFKKFKKEDRNDFYKWLNDTTNYIDDIIDLYSIYNMFELTHVQYLDQYDSIPIMNGPINKPNLRKILEKDGFIFPY